MNILIRINRRDILALILILLVGFFLLSRVYTQPPEKVALKQRLQKLETVYKIIKDHYVEEVSAEDIFNNAFQGMLSRLDPYSEYLSPTEYQELEAETRGEFGGVGIEVTMEEGIFTVISPLEDTPAFRAGILPGDRILEIDAESIEGLSVSDCVKRIRGNPDTLVTLTVLHKGETTPTRITLRREIIKTTSIKRVQLINPEHKIGFIQITSFQKGMTKDFVKAVQKLDALGMKSLIIDLRFNPGGLLEEAVALGNLFINNGIIVSTKGRSHKEESYWADPSQAIFKDLPLVVLINGASASAAEVFAGAIQDCQKGKLIGSRSFGKGLVQMVVPIPQDKSAVRLTVARYYTPSGKCIQRKGDQKNYGLSPDILVEMTPHQEADLLRARLNPTETFDDIQLNKAIEILSQPEKSNHRSRE